MRIWNFMYFCKLKIQKIRIMSSQNNVLKLILLDARTVFPIQSMVMLSGISDGVRLTKMLNYYVKKGDILNPRRGIYTKPNYNAEELACAIFHPSYISLEYVLKQAGVIFQYDSTITSVSYLTRNMEVDGKNFSFRQIKPELWMGFSGTTQQGNVCRATPERAFLDMLYLSAGNCYFDNLRPLKRKEVLALLPSYQSKTLVKNAKKFLNI